MAKFGKNRPLRSCRKVVWFGGQKNCCASAPLGRSRPKFRELCRLLICVCVPNLVRMGCCLLLQKD